MIPRNASIAVLGGGASGLSFAAAMRERGFTRVTVFERNARVGGKCCTVEIEGRLHDLGATMGVPGDYDGVLALSRDITNDRFPPERHFSLQDGREVSLNRWVELPRVLFEAARYFALHKFAWRGVDGSGLHLAPRELQRPWAEMVQRRNLHAVSRRTLCYRAGYGYGFDDEVPALMYANLFRPQTFLGLMRAPAFVWRGGTQQIWESLAQTLDVRTRAEIVHIDRDSNGVTLALKHSSERFDGLVLTLDPRDSLPLLDATDEERRWFSQAQSLPYATFACAVDGLEEGRASVGYLDENMLRERAGHPMAWVKRYADQNIFVFHLFAPPELSDGDCEARIAEDVARLGGRLIRVETLRRWSFFPYFPTSFIEGGGLEAIERWQGSTRTWMIGEVLSFASLSRVNECARKMAERLASPAAVLSSLAQDATLPAELKPRRSAWA